MYKIIIDDKIPFLRGEAEKLGSCTYLPGASITAADVRSADLLIVRTRTRVDKALLAGSQVRAVVTATIGYDHLDTAWLDAAGIRWTNCPGCNATSVAQYVRCCLLRLDGALPFGHITLGVVGVGHVGGAVLRDMAASGLFARLLPCDPPRQERGDAPPEGAGVEAFASLDEIAAKCDVITFHTPLTHTGSHATYHLADAAFFDKCRRRPLIINTARGGVVDEAALLGAMNVGQAAGAIVDTWEGEPRVNAELLRRAVFATPHIAGYSADGKATASRMALEAAARFLGVAAEFHIVPPEAPQGYTYNPYPDRAHPDLLRYDPKVDSTLLKCYPALFEALRGNYPLRCEA